MDYKNYQKLRGRIFFQQFQHVNSPIEFSLIVLRFVFLILFLTLDFEELYTFIRHQYPPLGVFLVLQFVQISWTWNSRTQNYDHNGTLDKYEVQKSNYMLVPLQIIMFIALNWWGLIISFNGSLDGLHEPYVKLMKSFTIINLIPFWIYLLIIPCYIYKK